MESSLPHLVGLEEVVASCLKCYVKYEWCLPEKYVFVIIVSRRLGRTHDY